MQPPQQRARPGDRFRSRVSLTPAAVSDFARAAGDQNPIHRDPEAAARTRFGRVIASGPHTSALLMGLTATHFSETGAMLGLDFSFRFKRPVFADDEVRLEWLVIRVRPNERLGGELVDLRGRLVTSDGTTAVGARGRVLLLARP